MKFIILIGPQAVGKMTVGQELEKLTGLKLFHNHMTIDLVSKYFGFSTPEGQQLVETLRIEFFRAFAASEQSGFIFTMILDFDDPDDYVFIKRITAIFDYKDADVYWIELEADVDERLARNRSENRLAHKPSKRDVEKSDKHLLYCHTKYQLNSRPGEITREKYLKIENTHLSAQETAQKICDFIRSDKFTRESTLPIDLQPSANAAELLMYNRLEPGKRQMKIMRLVASIAIDEKLLDIKGLRDRLFWMDTRKDEYIQNVFDDALKLLVAREDIEVFGDINNWRFAEIKRV